MPFLCALVAFVYLFVISVQLSVIDIRSHTLPNRIVLPAYPFAGVLLAVSAVLAGAYGHLWRALLGACVVGALYWVLWALYPAGMGFGDVKLAGVLGLYLGFMGWTHVLLGAAGGFVVGGLWGVAVIATRRGTVRTHIPFGPSMLVGAWTVLLLLPV